MKISKRGTRTLSAARTKIKSAVLPLYKNSISWQELFAFLRLSQGCFLSSDHFCNDEYSAMESEVTADDMKWEKSDFEVGFQIIVKNRDGSSMTCSGSWRNGRDGVVRWGQIVVIYWNFKIFDSVSIKFAHCLQYKCCYRLMFLVNFASLSKWRIFNTGHSE